MSAALITTIIPTYKRASLLKRAILSALNQTVLDIEVYVYDNASEDATSVVVEEIARVDSRVKYYCHASPVKAAQNFQFGMKQVKTPFFSILADDDLLAPDFYEIALSNLREFPAASFFLGSTLDVSSNGKVISANALDWEENKLYEPSEGLYKAISSYFNWTGSLFRRQILDKVEVDEEVKPIDLDFILRLAAEFPFVISKLPCALFIHHEESYSCHSGHKLVWPSMLKIIKNIDGLESLSQEVREKSKSLIFLRLRKSLFSIACGLYAAGEFSKANRSLEILSSQFPEYGPAKFLKSIGLLMEKNKLIFQFFRATLWIYRDWKRMPIQFRYGRFARKLISQYGGTLQRTDGCDKVS